MDDELLKLKKNSRIGALVTSLGVIAMLISFISLIWWNHTRQVEVNKVINEDKNHFAVASILRDSVSLLLKENERERISTEFLNNGIAYAETGKRKQAIDSYTKAIQLDSSSSTAYNLRGYLYYKNKNLPSALADLQRSVQLDSTNIWAHYNLALAYWSSGFQQSAISEVAKVIQIDDDFKSIIREDSQFKAFRKSPTFMEILH
ncbi:MAG TPA: tetratricopeptide repeat protein [Bacteroidota bacterium]|nr:tetratricopeptide repeat protein [Bacteroidota bacterium]